MILVETFSSTKMSLHCLETSTAYYGVTDQRKPEEQNPRLICGKNIMALLCQNTFLFMADVLNVHIVLQVVD